MNRVSSLSAFNSGLDELQRRQSSLARAQEQLTSGKRVVRASDDPTAAARAERALATVARSDANQRALDASRNAMALAESALGDAGSLLQDARQTIVSAGNPTYSSAERASLASHLSDLREQLLAIANRGDGAGGFLFSGQGTSTSPFSSGPGGVSYEGNSGEQMVASETPMPLTVDGRAAWMSAKTGNGLFVTKPGSPPSQQAWIDAGQVLDPASLTDADYQIQFTSPTTLTITRSATGNTPAATFTGVSFVTGKAVEIDGMSFKINGNPQSGDSFSIGPSTPTMSVFQALDTAIAGLTALGQTNAQISQTVSSGLRDVDSAMSTLQGVQARVGSLLTGADQAESRISDLKLYGQKERSAAEDLDMSAAISDFQNQQTGYQAALRSYASVQKMSLFDFING